MTNQLDPSNISEFAGQVLANCPLLRTKLARALFCTHDECQRALEEVIKFLVLAAENNQYSATPSARVDLAWHEFILFTRTYIGFCEHNFGRMVHHQPSSDHESNHQQYQDTLDRYRQRFGEPPAEFWGGPKLKSTKNPAAFCGSCESDL